MTARQINKQLLALGVIEAKDLKADLTDKIEGQFVFNPFKLHQLYITTGVYKCEKDNLLNALANRIKDEDKFLVFMRDFVGQDIQEWV